ncbi:hypothetical protein LUZ60_007617 [Juncus effusus]|nr:hypothetical protein LUZ60_007617 [Juncus effusus]
MAWFQRRLIFPIKRMAFAVNLRLRTRRNYNNIMKLYDQVKSCRNEDVHIMFNMLMATQPPRPRHRWFLIRRPIWNERVSQMANPRAVRRPI